MSILDDIKAAAKRRNEIEAKRPENPTNEQIAEWGRNDLWYLCRHIIGWEFYDCDYAKYFCEEVQKDPDRLFLVARGHLKSLTITCAKTIQDLACNPEISVALISYNGQTAKSFLRQIKNILETNSGLKQIYPDIFFEKPKAQSSLWSETEGINIKRTTTRKEPSVYAFGLIDSQKTGMHSDVLVYDDVIIQDSVTSAYMIQKTTRAWELSANLGMMTGPTRKRYCGTRYNYKDTYKEMLDRGIPSLVIPATHDGSLTGIPIHMDADILKKMLRDQGSYTFSSQMLLKPVPDGSASFNVEDIEYYDKPEDVPFLMNKYLLVDSANTDKARSDYTSMLVLGIDSRSDIWLLDGLEDKINLGRRWNCLLDLSSKNKVFMVGYEAYGLQVDVEYFDMEIKRTRCRFPPIKRLTGVKSKVDRILRLVPLVEARRLHLPRSLVKTSYSSKEKYDLVEDLVEQLKDFPYGKHDDIIDCLSRIYDIIPSLPRETPEEQDGKIPGFIEELFGSQNKAKLRVNFLRKLGDKLTGVGSYGRK